MLGICIGLVFGGTLFLIIALTDFLPVSVTGSYWRMCLILSAALGLVLSSLSGRNEFLGVSIAVAAGTGVSAVAFVLGYPSDSWYFLAVGGACIGFCTWKGLTAREPE